MWNAISPGFELVSPSPIPATITITPRMRWDRQIKKLRQKAKLLRKIKHTETQHKEKILKWQPHTSLTKQQEEINQRINVKEGSCKRYWDRIIKYKAGYSKITKENSTNRSMERVWIQINNRRQKKQNNLCLKYGVGKNIAQMLNEQKHEKNKRNLKKAPSRIYT